MLDTFIHTYNILGSWALLHYLLFVKNSSSPFEEIWLSFKRESFVTCFIEMGLHVPIRYSKYWYLQIDTDTVIIITEINTQAFTLDEDNHFRKNTAIIKFSYSPMQLPASHDLDSPLFPGQELFPLDAVAMEQFRLRVSVPTPHETLHMLQLPQADHSIKRQIGRVLKPQKHPGAYYCHW